MYGPMVLLQLGSVLMTVAQVAVEPCMVELEGHAEPVTGTLPRWALQKECQLSLTLTGELRLPHIP